MAVGSPGKNYFQRLRTQILLSSNLCALLVKIFLARCKLHRNWHFTSAAVFSIVQRRLPW